MYLIRDLEKEVMNLPTDNIDNLGLHQVVAQVKIIERSRRG
jgi:hypothetical protein